MAVVPTTIVQAGPRAANSVPVFAIAQLMQTAAQANAATAVASAQFVHAAIKTRVRRRMCALAHCVSGRRVVLATPARVR